MRKLYLFKYRTQSVVSLLTNRSPKAGWEVIKKYVELGMGIFIVTDICLTGQEKLVRIPLNQYFPQRGYGLVLRKGRFLSPQARRFVEILTEVYGQGDAPELPKPE